MHKVTLKKEWRWRSHVYPVGTVFKLKVRQEGGAIYDFRIPDVCRGLIFIPDEVHKAVSDFERALRKSRAEKRAEHVASYAREMNLIL